MKKLAMLLCIAFISGLAFLQAQTTKGKILLGATSYAFGMPISSSGGLMTLGFGSTKFKSNAGSTNGDKLTNFNLQPKAGYFVIDNLAVGLETMIVSSSSKDPDTDDKFTTSIFVIGPFIRYYLPMSMFSPFAELEFGIGNVKYKETGTDNYTEKYNATIIGAGVGMAVPLGNMAALDLVLGYNSAKIKPTDNNQDNYRIVTGGIGLKLGFVLFLGGSE